VTKVLYVEDNDDNVFMLKMRLELLGDFEVLTAEDGEKGCTMAVSERPDIILMDLEMPVVDGWEATRRLKGDPQTCDIPIIALSAQVNAKRRSRRGATSSTPNRSNLIGWSRPCGVFSRTASEAFHLGVRQRNREGEKNVEISNYAASPPRETASNLADFHQREGDAHGFAGKGREIGPALRSDRTLPKPTCVARCLRSGAPPLRVTLVETGGLYHLSAPSVTRHARPSTTGVPQANRRT
jgi:CheY-like chemotaxis protein